MPDSDLLSVSSVEWERFWEARWSELRPEGWLGRRFVQRWDEAVARERGLSEIDARLLAEYGLPAYDGPLLGEPSGDAFLASRPALLPLPAYASSDGRSDRRFLAFAGSQVFAYCFLRRRRFWRAVRPWPVYYVSFGYTGDRRLPVSPDLRSAMEASYAWHRHMHAAREDYARWFYSDDPGATALAKVSLARLADDLVAVGAIGPGEEPPHRRPGFWARKLDWQRIEMLGEAYE